MDRSRSSQGSSPGLPWLALAAVAVGLALRALEAGRKSLWIDEMHSLWAAAGEGVAQVIERVRLDFHPPVYFLLLHVLRGVDPEGQRWLSIAFSLATFVPLLALARAAGLSPLARTVAAGVFATSAYQILYAAELRAYSALGLAAVVMAWAAFTDRAPARVRFVTFTAAVGIGLNLHYFAGVAALCVIAAQPIVHGGARGRDALAWKRLLLAGALGFALFLPWLLAKERWILTHPEKMWAPEPAAAEGRAAELRTESSRRDQNLRKALEIPLRTQVPMLSSLGRPVAKPASLAAALFFALVLAGVANRIARSLRARAPPVDRCLAAMLVAAAAAYACGIALCLGVWQGFPGQYFVIGAWIWPLACGALVDGFAREGTRRVFAATLLAASLASGSLHVFGDSRENLRAAVRVAVRGTDPAHTIYTSVLRQPTWYPQTLPYRVYAPDVDAREPKEVPRADGQERRAVAVITRNVSLAGDTSMPDAWQGIRGGRKVAQNWWIDKSIRVVVYEPE